MKTNRIYHLVTAVLIMSMAAIVSCGDDDGDTTNVVVNPDVPENEVELEREGPIATSPTIIINNRLENNVTVINRSRIVRRTYEIHFVVTRLDPVVHPIYVHIASTCPTLQNDRNGDGILDQQEVEAVAGAPVLLLDREPLVQGNQGFQSGSEINYNQILSLDVFRGIVPVGHDFIVMVYGVDPSTPLPSTVVSTTSGPNHEAIPVACKVFPAPELTSSGNGGTTSETIPNEDGTTEE
jgi:hypothetical protein